MVGFGQSGGPFTGTMPQATLSSDNAAQDVIQFDPSTGMTTAVANGVSNITATLTTAEGKSLSDTESVTVNISGGGGGGGNDVLTSIKVAFDTGLTPATARFPGATQHNYQNPANQNQNYPQAGQPGYQGQHQPGQPVNQNPGAGYPQDGRHLPGQPGQPGYPQQGVNQQTGQPSQVTPPASAFPHRS